MKVTKLIVFSFMLTGIGLSYAGEKKLTEEEYFNKYAASTPYNRLKEIYAAYEAKWDKDHPVAAGLPPLPESSRAEAAPVDAYPSGPLSSDIMGNLFGESAAAAAAAPATVSERTQMPLVDVTSFFPDAVDGNDPWSSMSAVEPKASQESVGLPANEFDMFDSAPATVAAPVVSAASVAALSDAGSFWDNLSDAGSFWDNYDASQYYGDMSGFGEYREDLPGHLDEYRVVEPTVVTPARSLGEFDESTQGLNFSVPAGRYREQPSAPRISLMDIFGEDPYDEDALELLSKDDRQRLSEFLSEDEQTSAYDPEEDFIGSGLFADEDVFGDEDIFVDRDREDESRAASGGSFDLGSLSGVPTPVSVSSVSPELPAGPELRELGTKSAVAPRVVDTLSAADLQNLVKLEAYLIDTDELDYAGVLNNSLETKAMLARPDHSVVAEADNGVISGDLGSAAAKEALVDDSGSGSEEDEDDEIVQPVDIDKITGLLAAGNLVNIEEFLISDEGYGYADLLSRDLAAKRRILEDESSTS